MQADQEIQQTWLVMLKESASSTGPLVRPLGEGYYAVVLRPSVQTGKTTSTSADFDQVKPCIADLDHTRAVYLDTAYDSAVPDVPRLASWAGPAAAEVVRGRIHAFAVVRIDEFSQHLVGTLSANGWELKQRDQSLLVSDGQFIEQVNLLRVLVRMVLSRSTIATATDTVVREINTQLLELGELFREFGKRFRHYDPTVFEHYFVAYPAMSPVGAGWDYWEVAGLDHRDAQEVFEGAMWELQEVLQAIIAERLPDLFMSAFNQGNHWGHA